MPFSLPSKSAYNRALLIFMVAAVLPMLWAVHAGALALALVLAMAGAVAGCLLFISGVGTNNNALDEEERKRALSKRTLH